MHLPNFILLPYLIFSLLGLLQIPVHGFTHTSLSRIGRSFDNPTTTPSPPENIRRIQPTRRSITSSSSRLFVDLWDRMEIDEDEGHEWYLLNCVAGLEIDLLRQCRAKMDIDEMPAEDVVKFVVPTIIKTRSHGANRMVRETKVKYQGYVFAKLRLSRKTYTTIQKMDLCRSFMGTINIKGHKKLPPAPLPLGEEEIENFDLENVKWEKEDKGKTPQEGIGIIVDTVENDMKDREKEEAIENEVKTVYMNLKVEDMVKVTAKNKFIGEDGIVRRLKEGNVLIRFFTYGTMYEEWLNPSDVRKLTEIEIVDGLGGPGAPITQRDLDGPQDDRRNGGSRSTDDSRNQVNAFGGGPNRNRRQDRTGRSFQKDNFDPKKERDNWNSFKENEKRNESGTRERGGRRTEGAGPSRRQEDDWSSFVSQSLPASKTKQINSESSKDETDVFFSSLMSDLSKDMDENQGRSDGKEGRRDLKPIESTNQDSDDDFFAQLMSEIENEPLERTKTTSSTSKKNNDDDDDFFASLEKEIEGPPSSENKYKPKGGKSNLNVAGSSESDTYSASTADEDDFFASLEMELAADLGDTKEVGVESKKEVATSSFATDVDPDDHDFFSSLEEELRSDLHQNENESNNSPKLSTSQYKETKPKILDDVQAPTIQKSTEEKENAISSIRSSFDATALQKTTVPQLKNILRDRGLKVSGKKAELIERITSSV